MNFKQLETFVWVATLGSFRKAAERLFTTQPGISTRISGLEDELGVKLFEREGGPGPISLTAKGKDLLPYAEKIIFMSEQLRKHADTGAQLSGILRLGVSETVVHTWLPDFLRSLHRQMPNLDVEMTVDVTGNLRTGLLDRSLDLAFLMGPVSEPTVADLPLCSFPLVWVASPDLKLPERMLYLEELSEWPIITYARNTKPFAELSQKFRELDSLPPRFFTSSSLAACRRLTLDGIGISTLPYEMITPALDSGELVRVRAIWTPSELAFTASYPVTPFNPLAEVAAKLAVTTAQQHQVTDYK
ncbi:LysR family transcriptional regulator [Marinobacterium sp. D7]|uniref:LysR family transcriptional regulator n=1 Tax=Marinobacterium ramblicola TaxID=2849041 RepID=UPI001C2CC662|nr:LysR family transcriptional regulator [Marinobacterium ramblicola]MBV1789703.1 LysR family transcriptional regulator [Marinobacterium ramblicola]